MKLQIRAIKWQLALPIRHQVLWPNKPEQFCKLDSDENALHFGVFVKEKLVCVASVFINEKQARLRKFATLGDYQGQGVGTKLIQFILSELKGMKIITFWCDARKTAIGFYTRLGMKQEGKEFDKSGELDKLLFD